MNKRRRFKAKRRRFEAKRFRRFCGGYIAPRGFNPGCIAPYTGATVPPIHIGIDWGTSEPWTRWPCAPV